MSLKTVNTIFYQLLWYDTVNNFPRLGLSECLLNSSHCGIIFSQGSKQSLAGLDTPSGLSIEMARPYLYQTHLSHLDTVKIELLLVIYRNPRYTSFPVSQYKHCKNRVNTPLSLANTPLRPTRQCIKQNRHATISSKHTSPIYKTLFKQDRHATISTKHTSPIYQTLLKQNRHAPISSKNTSPN